VHWIDLLRRILTKFNLYFSDVSTNIYKIWKFQLISRIYLNN
jgi:hypothetical protein